MRDRSVVRSSVIPSAKYSCSGSRAALVKGSTTMDCGGARARSFGSGTEVGGAIARRLNTAEPRDDESKYIHSASEHSRPSAAGRYQRHPLSWPVGGVGSVGKVAMVSGPSRYTRT